MASISATVEQRAKRGASYDLGAILAAVPDAPQVPGDEKWKPVANSIKSTAAVSSPFNLCVPPRPLRLRGELFRLMTTSSPNTRSPASANSSTYTQAPHTFACPGIAIATPGLPSIEEVETELGRIGESD